MTRDEILALKPGRLLDTLIAEKVMGWASKKRTSVKEKDPWSWMDSKIGYVCSQYNFEPSGEIADAWMVVEKMGELDYYCWCHNEFVNRCWWEVNFHKNIPPHFDSKVWRGETLPEAICKAALLAVMEEEDG